jgi:ABC-type amino acid transport system permease subunit
MEEKKVKFDVSNLQGHLVDLYDEGFALAVQQIKVIAPNVDVSKSSSQLVVKNGELVPVHTVQVVVIIKGIPLHEMYFSPFLFIAFDVPILKVFPFNGTNAILLL